MLFWGSFSIISTNAHRHFNTAGFFVPLQLCSRVVFIDKTVSLVMIANNVCEFGNFLFLSEKLYNKYQSIPKQTRSFSRSLPLSQLRLTLAELPVSDCEKAVLLAKVGCLVVMVSPFLAGSQLDLSEDWNYFFFSSRLSFAHNVAAAVPTPPALVWLFTSCDGGNGCGMGGLGGRAGPQACSLRLCACAQAYGHGSDRLALLCALHGALCSHLNLGD